MEKGGERVSVKETIDSSIEDLIKSLAGANDQEAEKIRDQIYVLESLKRNHDTT